MRRRAGSLPRVGVGSPQGGARQGLSLAAIEAARERQGGRCAVCLDPLPPVPYVDHDHSLAPLHGHPPSRGCRRCFRALLCQRCNSLLGFARDSVPVLEAAIAYLRAWAARRA